MLPAGNIVQRRISEIGIGDHVASVDQAGNIIYEPVVLFTHRQTGQTNGYVKISSLLTGERSNATNQIILSSMHMIPIVKQACFTEDQSLDLREESCMSLRAAKDVAVNDVLWASGGSTTIRASVVVSVEKHLRYEGAYHPRTMSSRIIVDGIVASCDLADNVFSPSIARIFLFPISIVTLVKRLVWR